MVDAGMAPALTQCRKRQRAAPLSPALGRRGDGQGRRHRSKNSQPKLHPGSNIGVLCHRLARITQDDDLILQHPGRRQPGNASGRADQYGWRTRRTSGFSAEASSMSCRGCHAFAQATFGAHAGNGRSHPQNRGLHRWRPVMDPGGLQDKLPLSAAREFKTAENIPRCQSFWAMHRSRWTPVARSSRRPRRSPH